MALKPVLILQHKRGLPPGYFGDYLARAGRPTIAVLITAAQHVPPREILGRFAGVALMGGDASALAKGGWIESEIAFLRAALDAGMPALGHGLGARILALAAGGSVHAASSAEVGWQPVSQRPEAAATSWLSRLAGGPHHVFMHHQETFEPPPGALALLSSTIAPCQAFVSGAMIGTQFHPEITRAAFFQWLSDFRETLPPPALSVQSVAEMEREIAGRIGAARGLAATLYDYWLGQLEPSRPSR